MHQQLGTLVLSAFASTAVALILFFSGYHRSLLYFLHLCVLRVFLHFVNALDVLVGLNFRVSLSTLNYKYLYVRYLKYKRVIVQNFFNDILQKGF